MTRPVSRAHVTKHLTVERMLPAMWKRYDGRKDDLELSFLADVEDLLEELKRLPREVLTQNLGQFNRRKNNRNNLSSGIRGVTMSKGKYEARVRHAGKSYYLGRFLDPRAAGAAALEKRKELGIE